MLRNIRDIMSLIIYMYEILKSTSRVLFKIIFISKYNILFFIYLLYFVKFDQMFISFFPYIFLILLPRLQVHVP